MTDFTNEYKMCRLCARECGVDRTAGKIGYCKADDRIRVSRASLHMWEEPIISGSNGSGTIFFSGCSLGCIYCQNREISRGRVGKIITEERLSGIMLELMEKGAHNINLVTPTHYAPSIINSVRYAREKGLNIPIVYNTSSYDSPKTIDFLSGTVDIYLADMKYYLPKTARELSAAENYPQSSMSSIRKMAEQKGSAVIENGLMKSGVVVRILLLPGHLAEAKLIVSYLLSEYGNSIYLSLMSQYTPIGDLPKPLNRRVTKKEYAELCDYAFKKGLQNGFIQEGESASESFIPDFDLFGV